MSLLTRVMGEHNYLGQTPHSGKHRLNGGRADYAIYRCADGGYLAVGPIEPKFWANLCRALELPQLIDRQDDAGDDDVKRAIADRIATRTRDAWTAVLVHEECCVTPVLDLGEALADPHNRARHMVVDAPDWQGRQLPTIGVAPRLSDTPGAVRTPTADVGPAHTAGAAVARQER